MADAAQRHGRAPYRLVAATFFAFRGRPPGFVANVNGAAVKSNCICRCCRNTRDDPRDADRKYVTIAPSNRRAISMATARSCSGSRIEGPPVS